MFISIPNISTHSFILLRIEIQPMGNYKILDCCLVLPNDEEISFFAHKKNVNSPQRALVSSLGRQPIQHCFVGTILLGTQCTSIIFKREQKILLKVVQSQKVFHFASNLPKKVPKHSPEYYPLKRCFEILSPFWSLEPKWKAF